VSAVDYDVIVLGSGFGGSLLSAILAKSGLAVALIDSARHPRFAIGESSTPLADYTLAMIANEYDLPELLPLTKYGSWKREHAEIGCGLKRGFSYFGHRPETEFGGESQLLVAASSSDESSDTHWLRSDVDAFVFGVAKTHGVTTFEEATYQLHRKPDGWLVDGICDDNAISLQARFAVDATGSAGVVLKSLGIADQTQLLNTNSAAIFAHFANVKPVAECLDDIGVDRQRHPFPCDAAAVHHVLDSGWMWQLRFDDDTVSVGMMFGGRGARPMDTSVDLQVVWQQQIDRFPMLRHQFSVATIVRPKKGLQFAKRVQRLTTTAAGEYWAALPGTAGFIDPLHSTGIAHTLLGVRRLVSILLMAPMNRERQLQQYSDQLINELRLVDELVAGCYAALPSFQLWSAWCMLYFAAVTSMEQADSNTANQSFLRADDVLFREMLIEARAELRLAVADGSAVACDRFEQRLRCLIQPWNVVGLMNAECGGMYSHTAAN
jgi:FADH2 O2-dependent halogenase